MATLDASAGVATRRPIPVAGPWITEHEVEAVAEATRAGWYEHANDAVAAFEAAFAAHTGRRHAVALPSCTSGIHLVLAALGVGPGDEVIVPDLTWIATAAPISYVGATPVFADVDPLTWCLDPVSVEPRMSSRTRAVVAVDLYGGMPDYGTLDALCHSRGVPLIEDAAEAIGSRLHDVPAGGFGIASLFSFHGSKTLTTGEGGMVVTDDDQLWDRILVLRDHGRRAGDIEFYNHEIAYKYKMSALQAALGNAQLDRIGELVEKKREIFSSYHQRLSTRSDLLLNAEPCGTLNSYWMTTVVVDPSTGIEKGDLGAALAERSIATRPVFHPLSSLPAYASSLESHRARDANTVSRRLGRTGINLPSALRLTEDEIDYVCVSLEEVLRPRS